MFRTIHIFLSVVLIASFLTTGGRNALGQEHVESVEAEGVATVLQGNTDIARDKIQEVLSQNEGKYLRIYTQGTG